VPAIGFGRGKGTIVPRITDGRAPAADDEIALGARTLDEVGRSVGDDVEVQPGDGGRRIRYRIVGRSVMPSISLSENVGVADGATLTLRGLRRVDPGAATTFFFVDVRPGSGPAVAARYDGRFGVLGPQRPREILSFERVRSTPIVLAVILAIMGAAALAHALVLSVRDGRGELAVLKALGFTRAQVSAMVASHATTLALAALAIGLPLGIAAGRLSWDLFVGPYGLDAPPVVPLVVIAMTAVATLVLANIVAAIPARAASGTSPAIVLRTE
jgi:putative ABC transport system permease protein